MQSGVMAIIRDKSKELQLALSTPRAPVQAAKTWLEQTPHRDGCQCHRCHWAHGVIAGRIKWTFDDWRKR